MKGKNFAEETKNSKSFDNMKENEMENLDDQCCHKVRVLVDPKADEEK